MSYPLGRLAIRTVGLGLLASQAALAQVRDLKSAASTARVYGMAPASAAGLLAAGDSSARRFRRANGLSLSHGGSRPLVLRFLVLLPLRLVLLGAWPRLGLWLHGMWPSLGLGLFRMWADLGLGLLRVRSRHRVTRVRLAVLAGHRTPHPGLGLGVDGM